VAHDVFISYSSKDKPTADAVCAALEQNGIRCWIAPRDVLPGTSWAGSIVTAINGARVLVLVFSGHANASPSVEREIERAFSREIPVIPLRIENVKPNASLEFFVSTPHWLDAVTPPLEQHLKRLAEVVRSILQIIGDNSETVGPEEHKPSPNDELSRLNEAIRLDPKHADPYFERGSVYSGIGDHDRAIADYTNAISLGPKNAELYAKRGREYSAKADYDRAIADYSESIRLNFEDDYDRLRNVCTYDVYHDRGKAYVAKGDYDHAIADFSEAMSLDFPSSTHHRRQRAGAYAARGDYDNAIADYDELIKLNPKDADAYHLRGTAMLRRMT
jgi:tetratricopeptide (TPR) repeat protein